METLNSRPPGLAPETMVCVSRCLGIGALATLNPKPKALSPKTQNPKPQETFPRLSWAAFSFVASRLSLGAFWVCFRGRVNVKIYGLGFRGLGLGVQELIGA